MAIHYVYVCANVYDEDFDILRLNRMPFGRLTPLFRDIDRESETNNANCITGRHKIKLQAENI